MPLLRSYAKPPPDKEAGPTPRRFIRHSVKTKKAVPMTAAASMFRVFFIRCPSLFADISSRRNNAVSICPVTMIITWAAKQHCKTLPYDL